MVDWLNQNSTSFPCKHANNAHPLRTNFINLALVQRYFTWRILKINRIWWRWRGPRTAKFFYKLFLTKKKKKKIGKIILTGIMLIAVPTIIKNENHTGLPETRARRVSSEFWQHLFTNASQEITFYSLQLIRKLITVINGYLGFYENFREIINKVYFFFNNRIGIPACL